MEKIRILMDEPFHKSALKVLNSFADVITNNSDERVTGTTILIVDLKRMIDSEFIKQMPDLKIIATPTTGLDHIDLLEASKRNISVISLKNETDFLSQITSTAELAFCLILCLARNIIPSNNSVLEAEWNRSQFKGTTLRGQTLGIIGLGRLGKMVLEYGKSFGMKTIYTDPYVEGGLELNSLLSISDFVSIHVPLTLETENLLDDKSFKIMKKGSFLINTSRGKIVNEEDLISSLSRGEISGYGTDVLSNELSFTSTIQSPLIEYSKENTNVIITPHLGGMTNESREATDIFISEKVKNYCLSFKSQKNL